MRVLCPYLVISVRNKSVHMICNSCFESMLIRYYKKNAVYSNGKIDLSLHNGATLKRKAHASGAVVASFM